MAGAAEYQLTTPNPGHAEALLRFHNDMLAEQFRLAGAPKADIESHARALLAPDGIADSAAFIAFATDRDSGYYCRLVETAEGIQGMMLAHGADTLDREGNAAPLNQVSILELAPALRGAGLASRLMGDFFTRHARKTRPTELDVLAANRRARDYYERRWGFAEAPHNVSINVGSVAVHAVRMLRHPDEKRSDR